MANINKITNHIYSTLRDRICIRNYKRGTILKEGELATEFNVSRTPIREAIQLLRLDGLVESKKKVGTIVLGFDKTKMIEIYTVRIALMDYLAVESNQNFNNENIKIMDELLCKISILRSTKNIDSFWHINEVLHENLISVVQNQFLKSLTRTLFLQTARSWAYLLPLTWECSCENLKQEIILEKNLMIAESRSGVFSTFKSYAILSMDNCIKMYCQDPDIP